MSPRPLAAYVIAAAGLGALALPWQLAAVVIACVAAATAVDAFAARRRPEISRTVAATLVRGVPSPVTIGVAPGLTTRVRQAVPPDLQLEPQEATGELHGGLQAQRRGRHLLAGVATRVDGPLGLGCAYGTAGEPAEVRVYPDLPGARRIARSVQRGRFRHEGKRRGPLGLGTEFESVRDYLPDDDIRQLNWTATQRTGRPMSNQYRVERDRDVMLVLDCGRLMAAPLGAQTRMDAALDAALAVAAVAEELGDRVGALAFDARLRAEVSPRRKGTAAIAHAFFDLEPSNEDSDYERAFASLLGRKRAFVLVCTDLLDENAARPLLRALPMLARRHSVTVVTATDADIVALATGDPTGQGDAFRAAAAASVLAAFDRARALIGRAGADVVESPAETLPAACVSAYLRAKARQRI